jgi:hypothetical protein
VSPASPWPSVVVHPSQFPRQVDRELTDALRSFHVPGKLHYQSYRQAARWARVHQDFAPSQSVDETIHELMPTLRRFADAPAVEVFSLGCGAGEKDMKVVEALKQHVGDVRYVACDSSLALVLESMNRLRLALPHSSIRGLVADLVHGNDIQLFSTQDVPRIFLLFGMLPNLPAGIVLPRIKGWMKSKDALWVSANLAPGSDYQKGCEAVFPQYDNLPTRVWLCTLLEDLGIVHAGTLSFGLGAVAGDPELIQVTARFVFKESATAEVPEASVRFRPGDVLELFQSARYNVPLMEARLRALGFETLERSVSANTEEGLWVVA